MAQSIYSRTWTGDAGVACRCMKMGVVTVQWAWQGATRTVTVREIIVNSDNFMGKTL